MIKPKGAVIRKNDVCRSNVKNGGAERVKCLNLTNNVFIFGSILNVHEKIADSNLLFLHQIMRVYQILC